MVSAEITRAHVESELSRELIDAWVRQHGWQLSWDPAGLLLRATMRSKIDQEQYELELNLGGYRALPPLIELIHPVTGERGSRKCYPGGGRGYFHNQPVLCAPWNRKAYAAHGGPHGDWTLAQWATYRPNHARLLDILVLLQSLLDDRSSYSGRMQG
jgi:hypothetical protein